MKAIKEIDADGDIVFRYEDAIFYENDTFSLIKGDHISGYSVQEAQPINTLLEKQPDAWTTMNLTLQVKSDDFVAIAGETSWGGAGFVGVKNNADESLVWLMHLSNMNNPIKLEVSNGMIHLTTDMNFPNGLLYVIPILAPGEFRVETLK